MLQLLEETHHLFNATMHPDYKLSIQSWMLQLLEEIYQKWMDYDVTCSVLHRTLAQF